MLTDNDSILYTNFELFDEKIVYIFKKDIKSQENYNDKKFQENFTYLKRWCKLYASTWYWTNGCLIFVKNMIKSH